MKKHVLLTVLLITAFPAFAVDGYKEVKFGMTAEALVRIGGQDPLNKGCSAKSFSCKIPVEDKTLFGKPVQEVSAEFPSGTVSTIAVETLFSPKEFTDLANQSLGAPKRYSYISIVGKTINALFWEFSDGTSIKIVYGLGEENGYLVPNFFGGGMMVNKRTRAKYLNKEMTDREIAEFNKSGKTNSSDF